jgi:transposase
VSSKVRQREIEKLQAKLADRDAKIADRDARIEDLARDLAALKEYVHRLSASRSREHLIAEGQGVLFPDSPVSAATDDETASESEAQADEHDDDDGPPAKPKTVRKKKSHKIDTSTLPREDRMHELPEEERICPVTGLQLVPTGEKVFDEIDYQRARILLIRHHQMVYGPAPDDAIDRQVDAITAPMPPRPLEGCAASAMLLAWMIVQKYANHLPLNRQESIFARDGLRLPRQTLCDWILGATEALRPIADCLMAKVRAGPVMQLDDTPVKCQGGRGAKHFQAYLWTFVNPEVGGVAYRFTSGRSSDLIAAEIGGFTGWLVGDGYSGNKAASKKVEGDIKIGGCWAHVIRKFKDANDAPGTAKLFSDDIRRLFEVEQEADAAELDPEARLILRRKQSLPALVALRARARRLRDDYSDSDNIAKAIKYLHNQRRELRLFLKDGRIPIHNNACERSIRPIAVGRRNWLFAGSPRGGRAAAVAYTLIESCRIAKVDVVDYLADVLVRVATHPASRVEELLPDRWEALVTDDASLQRVLA